VTGVDEVPVQKSSLLRGRQHLAEGRERFELFVGACVLANNLMIIAQLLIQKEKRQRKAA